MQKYFSWKNVGWLAVLMIVASFSVANADITPLPRDDNQVPLQNTYRTMSSQRKTITASTTAEAISSLECKRVDLQALLSNTNNIAVGGTTTEATVGSEKGVVLAAGDTYTFYVDSCNDVYVDVITDGEGVSFNYFQ